MAINLQDLMLIEEIEKNPIIWDTRLKDYKNSKLKETIFQGIAEKLKLNVFDVEFRWKSLRKLYVRKKKEAIGKSGDGASSPWPYFRYLSFLAPTVRHRQTLSNAPVVINFTKNQDVFATDDEEDLQEVVLDESVIVDASQKPASPIVDIPQRSKSPIEDNPQTPNLPVKNCRQKIDRMMYSFLKAKQKEAKKEDINLNVEDMGHLDFFKSIIPMIRDWNHNQTIAFRTDVLALVHKYVNENI